MFRSYKVATVSGIGVYLHTTFLLLLGWLAFGSLLQGDGVLAALHILVPVMLFAVVVLHELGHALAARHFGIGTRDITLYPIGGVARLERMPTDLRQEIAIAAGGPAVNLALAAATWGLGSFVTEPLLGYLVAQLFTINVGLLLFNLLPAFPMDGGRILRAFLAMRSDYLTATRKAVSVSRAVTVLFALLGLATGNLNLLLIGAFVWLTGTAELAELQMRRFCGVSTFQPPRFEHVHTLHYDPRTHTYR